jgi:hypothetical protein
MCLPGPLKWWREDNMLELTDNVTEVCEGGLRTCRIRPPKRSTIGEPDRESTIRITAVSAIGLLFL